MSAYLWIATAAGAAIAAIVGIALNAVVGQEALGWMAYLSQVLVGGAVARLPEGERERWREEWSGDLTQFEDRPLTALLYAVRIALSAGKLRRELTPVPVLGVASNSAGTASAKARPAKWWMAMTEGWRTARRLLDDFNELSGGDSRLVAALTYLVATVIVSIEGVGRIRWIQIILLVLALVAGWHFAGGLSVAR